MKKIFVYFVILVIVLMLSIGFCVNRMSYHIETEKEKYMDFVGNKCVVDDDTLTITGYSILRENFVLSDGTEVGYDFVVSENQ